MTKKEALENGLILWNSLTEYPEKSKYDFIKSEEADEWVHGCPLCEFISNEQRDSIYWDNLNCDEEGCIINWPILDEGDKYSIISYPCLKSYYAIWENLDDLTMDEKISTIELIKKKESALAITLLIEKALDELEESK